MCGRQGARVLRLILVVLALTGPLSGRARASPGHRTPELLAGSLMQRARRLLASAPAWNAREDDAATADGKVHWSSGRRLHLEADAGHEAHQRCGKSGAGARRFVYVTEETLPEQQQQQDATERRSGGEIRSTGQEGAFDDIVSFLSMHPRR